MPTPMCKWNNNKITRYKGSDIFANLFYNTNGFMPSIGITMIVMNMFPIVPEV